MTSFGNKRVPCHQHRRATAPFQRTIIGIGIPPIAAAAAAGLDVPAAAGAEPLAAAAAGAAPLLAAAVAGGGVVPAPEPAALGEPPPLPASAIAGLLLLPP